MGNIEVGNVYASLQVISKDLDKYISPNGSSQIKWVCQCICGRVISVISSSLRTGNSKSCGCVPILNRTLHGKSKTKEYKIWHSMILRVDNENDIGYKNYGGRGITVCARWKEVKGGGFTNFLEDMGTCPKGSSLDRINVNGDYSKENCRWAISSVQAFNKRKYKNNISGYVGVKKTKSGKWVGEFRCGSYRCSKTLDTLDEIINWRRKLEIEYFGESKQPDLTQFVPVRLQNLTFAELHNYKLPTGNMLEDIKTEQEYCELLATGLAWEIYPNLPLTYDKFLEEKTNAKCK